MTSTTKSVVTKKSGTFIERHGWIVFLVLGLIITLFGLGDIVTGGATFEGGEAPTVQGISGMTWQELNSASPNAASMIDYLVRAGGINLFLLGFMSTVVAATAFRRGERWSWFAMWLLPLWLVMIVLLLLSVYKPEGPGLPPPLVSGSIFFVVMALTLALSFRKYFPKQQAAVGATVAG